LGEGAFPDFGFDVRVDLQATGMATLRQTIPALPVRNAAAAVDFYRDRLGFEVLHHDPGFAVLCRDDAVLHLWEASDETWSERRSLEQPVRFGAESFIAGTASYRIAVEGGRVVRRDARECVLHPVSKDAVETTAFGTREFATLDLDGNLVTFFQWTES
jgi:catechol 2,3-dioxygenase-like lactoylglutathione lyase family enzyme